MGLTKTLRSGGILSATALGMGLVLVGLLAPAIARAEQFVLFDVKYTYTQADAVNAKPSKSHFYVRSQMNPARPKDWTMPVDYRNGTVHVRTEVIDKPTGSVATAWTLCYIPYKGIASGYGCTNTSTFTEEGIFDRDVGMTTWWQNEDIVWNMGIQGMDLVLKDDKGVFSHLRPDPEHFFPTTVRITMIQVSAGAKYDPSMVPNLPTGPAPDGGAGPDATPVDATAPADTGSSASGGASGSGGSSGTGGSAPAGTGGASGPSTGSGGTPGPGPGETGSVSSGCAIGNAASAGWGSAVLLGVAFLLRRRRR